MILLRYDPAGGVTATDKDWITLVDILVKEEEIGLNNGIAVGNSLPILYLLTLVAERRVSHEVVQFMYEGEVLRPNEYGSLTEWPRGFCEAEHVMSERRLLAMVSFAKDTQKMRRGEQ